MAGRLSKFWYVAETLYKREGEAKRELTQQGYTAEYPMLLLPRNRLGVRRPVPLFEGYVFVRACECWRSINGTRGVRGVLMGTGEQPSVIDDSEIQYFIRDSVDERGYFRDPEEPVRTPGDLVAPRSGRFAGIYGEFLKMSSHSRCEVLFWLLGRTVISTHLVSDLA